MSEHYYAVIMAGGGGTRLWPLSRKETPKQMLALVGERTLFQITVDRLLDLLPLEQILVVTSAAQAIGLQAQYPELPAENFLLEPAPRNSAPAVGFAAAVLKQRDPDAVMAMLTADHYIENTPHFLHILRAAEQVAQEGHLVTLGIEPTFPATGFGYIQQGDSIGEFEEQAVFQAVRFKEKPDVETAEKMLAAGDHAWNSGMFIWRADTVLDEFSIQMPEFAANLEKLAASWDSPDQQRVLEEVWAKIDREATSIDFGIMESAKSVAVIPAGGLGWNDVGSWNALFDVKEKDPQGNIFECDETIALDTENTLVYANGASQRLVVTIGVKDLVIVDTGDVLLVCHKDQAQDVREVVKLLKEQDRQAYL